jgi:putative cardiolipin synthase
VLHLQHRCHAAESKTLIRNRATLTTRCAVALLAGAVLGACSTLPPGSDYPRTVTVALANPETTTLGRSLRSATLAHEGKSGFRFLSRGTDGFLTRMQMINAAEKTLDLQYFIFRGDDTGRMLTDAALRAADRGVRVRLLLDDGETISGDEQVTALAAHHAIEIRVFNPFAYRGHSSFLRASEFIFNASRLDYRMHNKLMVVDNSVALMGGRNVGDEYFQVDSEAQFADDDIFVVGPIAGQLSGTFDEFWNNPLSIPIEALSAGETSHVALQEHRELSAEEPPEVEADGVDYAAQVATGEPLAGMVSGRLPIVWANARLVSDSPDKKEVEEGSMMGRLMHRPVATAALAAQSELLMITPYLIPGEEGMEMFADLRRRNVRIRILTNSLEASTVLLAQSGYMRYRVPLLEDGIELYEIRSQLGNARGSGQTTAMSRHGNYSLHAKMFVFDRQELFVGSMNFDQRSMHLNTEIGLIIDSPELAEEIARRFEAMVRPVNSYQLLLQPHEGEDEPKLVWHTEESGKLIDYETEPAQSDWQRLEVKGLSILPIGKEL